MPYKNPEDAKRRQKERHAENPRKRKEQWAAWKTQNAEHNRTRQEKYTEQKRNYRLKNYALDPASEIKRNKEYIARHPEAHRARVEKRRFSASIHLQMAARHASEKKVPFDLAGCKHVLQEGLDAGHCELSGLPFSTIKIGSRRPFLPSLDRIKPELGYVPGNVRIVLWALNCAMSTWGLDVLLDIVDAVRAKT